MAVKQLIPAGDFPAPGMIRRLASAFYDFLLSLAMPISKEYFARYMVRTPCSACPNPARLIRTRF